MPVRVVVTGVWWLRRRARAQLEGLSTKETALELGMSKSSSTTGAGGSHAYRDLFLLDKPPCMQLVCSTVL